jgi:hypothetical protein
VIIACDFLVVETVLLKRLYALVSIEHGTRRLHVAGVTAHPTGASAVQQARDLAMDLRSRALAGSRRFPAPRHLAGCPAAFQVRRQQPARHPQQDRKVSLVHCVWQGRDLAAVAVAGTATTTPARRSPRRASDIEGDLFCSDY